MPVLGVQPFSSIHDADAVLPARRSSWPFVFGGRGGDTRALSQFGRPPRLVFRPARRPIRDGPCYSADASASPMLSPTRDAEALTVSRARYAYRAVVWS